MELVRDPRNNQGNLQTNLFGGLNTETSKMNLPIQDSPVLINFDVTPTGKLIKRQGTRVIYEENTNTPLVSYSLILDNGISLLIVKTSTHIKVLQVDNDTTIVLYTFENVFTNPESRPNITLLPEGYIRVLFLTPENTPVQLTILSNTVKTSLSSTVIKSKQPYGFDSRVFVNNQYTTEATVLRNSEGVEITLNNTPEEVVNVTVLNITWQWWAESEIWFGENFFRGVSRYGANQSDQHVQVPLSVLSDSENEYLLQLYSSTNFYDRYIEAVDQQPEKVDQYSFSDATDYKYTEQTYVTKSPFFVTFGRNCNQNRIQFTDEDVDPLTNRVTIENHGFINKEAVRVTSIDGDTPVNVTPGVTLYVQVLDESTVILHGSESLTNPVDIGNRSEINFTDVNVDFTNNTFNIISHGLTNGDMVKYISDILPLDGLSTATVYYVGVIDSNNFKLYFDRERIRPVDIGNRVERAFSNTEVDDTSNWIIITSHLLFDGRPVRFRPAAGVLPSGITAFAPYTVSVLSPDIIQFYDEFGTQVTDFSGSSGICYLMEDGGNQKFRLYGGVSFIERPVKYNSVYFSRRRKLSFNNSFGINFGNLYVTVDHVRYYETTSPLFATFDQNKYVLWSSANTYRATGELAKYISFEAAPKIGLDRTSVVRLTNTNNRHIGSGSLTLEDRIHRLNGCWVPAYGFGFYADYNTGVFPTVATVYQSRLVLSGFSNFELLTIVSSVSDTKFGNEFYNYFQVTDDLEQPSIDPFDFILNAQPGDYITGLLNYQSNLFIFTRDSVYRTFGSSPITTENRVIGLVANQGAINQNGITTTENTVYYLSSQGLYDLNTIQQEEYRASEVSIKIRSFFKTLSNQSVKDLSWIVYDKDRLKLYVGIPSIQNVELKQNYTSILLVFDTTTEAWTEYYSYAGFNVFRGLIYTDQTLGRFVLLSCKTYCENTLVRFNYNKYGDFIRKYTNLTSPITGIPKIAYFTTTYSTVDTYYPDNFFINPNLNVLDISVKYGDSLDNLTILLWKQQWVKANNGGIKLLYTPGDLFALVIEPFIDNQTNALAIWKNNTKTTYEPTDFLDRPYTNLCNTIQP